MATRFRTLTRNLRCLGPPPPTHPNSSLASRTAWIQRRFSSGKAMEGSDSASMAQPEFIGYRLEVWDRLKKKAEGAVAQKAIEITLPDGKVVSGVAGVTTPHDIAMGISAQFAKKFVVARVDGKSLHDMGRPLEDNCKLEFMGFDTAEGKHVFWHSSAHVLGEALELKYAGRLCIGPPISEGGFFYDIQVDENQKVSSDDFDQLNKFIKKIMDEKQPFERLEITKEEALELFKYNPFKLDIIQSKVPDNGTTTAYRCGPLIDLCKGPHILSTGVIEAFEVTKNSGSYWKGDVSQPMLQRIYGISFPDKKKMKEYKKFRELAAQRDHRKIGDDQQLFFFDKLSPGSCFFLPHGTRIYNKLQDYIRNEYVRRGYEEVITPNVYNLDLWRTSGHLENYKDNMFIFEVEKQEFGLKPMNCPGHCLMFKHKNRSYRDLPIRYADFGVLHRNEVSGALTGLTRVRRFQQDDAHIFCTMSQIAEEVFGVLNFLETVYGVFGFKFSLALSTRPAKALGDVELWKVAEKALEDVLNKFGKPWSLNPGDGAFYGPKIDIRVTDALRRKHQCATIQLDFQLPIRFDLQYKTDKLGEGSDSSSGVFERPVIIHRAILGSLERFIAVLTEHTGGKWPFWVSPRQAMVVPISLNFSEYAESVCKRLRDAGFYVDVNNSTLTLNKKIRQAQLSQYNYILVVGQAEVEGDSVNVRTRDNKVHGTVTIADLILKFKQLSEAKEMDQDLQLLDVGDLDDSPQESLVKPAEDDEDFL